MGYRHIQQEREDIRMAVYHVTLRFFPPLEFAMCFNAKIFGQLVSLSARNFITAVFISVRIPLHEQIFAVVGSTPHVSAA
jgi:hypothetical protein